jgi:hypothetical protein
MGETVFIQLGAEPVDFPEHRAAPVRASACALTERFVRLASANDAAMLLRRRL